MFAGLLLAAATVQSTVATSRGDQPFIVYPPARPAPAEGAAPPGSLVLILSGEGGWRSFDDQLATWLSGAGYWVGGMNCMKYFWKAQDDREALAADVRRFVDALVRASGAGEKAKVVIAGFSFGADLAPWIAGSRARDPRVAGLVLIGPDRNGSLEFRLSEMLGSVPTEHVFDTAGALADAKEIPVLFIHGGNDPNSDAPTLARGFPGRKELAVVPDSTHHFAGHEDELRRALLAGVARLLTR